MCILVNSDKCLKLVVNGEDKETKRELVLYKQLEKSVEYWLHIPRCYGQLETDMGYADVFDVIRDCDGSVSKTLEYYLLNKWIAVDDVVLSKALTELHNYLMGNTVVTMAIKSNNILLQKRKQSAVRLIIVDNLGSSDFIPLASYVPFFARKKIARKGHQFIDSLHEGGALWRE